MKALVFNAPKALADDATKTGAHPIRDAEQEPPRGDGVVPLRGKAQSASGGSNYIRGSRKYMLSSVNM
ncbi:MAG: hypothetical protein RR574_02945, partial [Comamonas sp.]